MFRSGIVHDVKVRDLRRYVDERGWLIELFRQDELDPRYFPVMSYVSMTHPGVVRGPHEHVDQADCFAFIGPSTFRVYLWDSRKDSPTFMVRQRLEVGEGAPAALIIPAGVVHAYKNIGGVAGWVINLPNRLYAGRGKKEKVDEIRHEADPNSIFQLD
jgi:dTDP-4-dehydrorhamnose 3,5-epimerase